ncbi:MAG: GNAT family N-acetyltransferase [Gammaproteobacteria bacterium]|nr:GNAT family N-acetyltransferase [Gammaproteobacteria bacterium]
MISIRDATAADADRVHALHVASSTAVYQQLYGDEGLDQWLATRSPAICAEEIAMWAVVVAERDDALLGFGALETVKGNIGAVYVAPDHWRQGIGRQLMLRLEAIAAAARLSRITLQAAGPAIQFYLKQGFTTPKELGPNPAWAEMEKRLASNGPSSNI